MSKRIWWCVLVLGCALVGAAGAQTQAPGTPGVVVGGSGTVSVGGLPAARSDDPTGDGGRVEEGSRDVSINGRPAARVGDRTGCGVVVRGSNNVFINGRPMTRTGDATSGC